MKNNSEASFFGVNYTTPFAYAYRAHKALMLIWKKQFSRVFIILPAWPRCIPDTCMEHRDKDSAGNLLENDHLRLFDFLSRIYMVSKKANSFSIRYKQILLKMRNVVNPK
jgi:hypothetical protein